MAPLEQETTSMPPTDPKKQRSIRIALPEALYEKLKAECLDHGDLSKLVRQLLIKYLNGLEGI